MSAQHKEEQDSAQIVRYVSEMAGTLVGATVEVGRAVPELMVFGNAKTRMIGLESDLASVSDKLAESRI